MQQLSTTCIAASVMHNLALGFRPKRNEGQVVPEMRRRFLHRIDWVNVAFWSAAFLSGLLLLGGLGFMIHHALFALPSHP